MRKPVIISGEKNSGKTQVSLEIVELSSYRFRRVFFGADLKISTADNKSTIMFQECTSEHEVLESHKSMKPVIEKYDLQVIFILKPGEQVSHKSLKQGFFCINLNPIL